MKFKVLQKLSRNLQTSWIFRVPQYLTAFCYVLFLLCTTFTQKWHPDHSFKKGGEGERKEEKKLGAVGFTEKAKWHHPDQWEWSSTLLGESGNASALLLPRKRYDWSHMAWMWIYIWRNSHVTIRQRVSSECQQLSTSCFREKCRTFALTHY